MIYVYQLSVRKSNDEKRQYVIETDLITTEQQLNQEFVDETAQKYQCDVKLTYIGELIPSNDGIEFTKEFYTKEQIAKQIQEWQNQQIKEFNENVN